MKDNPARQAEQKLYLSPERNGVVNSWPEGSQLTMTEGWFGDSHYKIILDSVDEAVALIDIKEYAIVRANQSFYDKYGNDVIGKPCYAVTHHRTTPCGDEHCHCPLVETLKTKRTSVLDHQHVDHNGGVTHANITSYPVFDDDGEIAHIVHVERDISAQWQYEEDLRNAKAAADLANKTKSRFLANMSHEIRTPMNAVMGLTDLALELSVDKEQEKYLKTIKTSAQILLGIINDILDFSKIEAGQVAVDKKVFCLGEVIEENIRLLEVNARAKGIVLCLDLPFDKKGEVVGDPLRLQQIITNIVTNAIKFTESGYVRLRVEVEDESEENISLRFSVKDTGVGIVENEQAQVFDAFKQVGGVNRSRLDGTGLGLSIVKKLVGLMGGNVWLESQIGKGTTFYFTLVLEKAGRVKLEKAALPSPLISLSAGQNHVLIVSNSKSEQQLLTDILKERGLLAQIVETDEDVCERIIAAQEGRHLPYRLIILGKTDFPIRRSKAVRLNKEYQVPIVRIVGGGEDDFCEHCHEFGVCFCLPEPLFISDLQEGINDIFSGKRLCRQKKIEAVATGQRPITIAPRDVLLAEDNSFNAMLAQTLLEKMGHNVMVVETGVEALKALCKKSFDLVLMDVEMPEMDGLRAIKILRRCEQSKKTKMAENQQLAERLHAAVYGKHNPVVAMTANAMVGDMEKCLEAGMDDYIAKPFQPDDLVRVFARFQPPENQGAKKILATGEIEEGERPSVCPQRIKKFLIEQYHLEAEVAQNLADGIGPSIKKNLVKMRQALGDRDNGVMRLAVHSIKGSLLHAGLNDFAEQAQRIETALYEEDNLDFCEQISRLSTVLHPLLTMQSEEEAVQENLDKPSV